MKREYHLLALPALCIIALDQTSKFAVNRHIQSYESIPVISGFFNLVHVRNRGMAFGILNRPDYDFSFYFLVAATVGAIALLLYWYTSLKDKNRVLVIGLSFILGGAVGNLMDRLRLREVIDFLDFHIGLYHWPAFNVADSAITVGTFWVAINLLLTSPKKSQMVD